MLDYKGIHGLIKETIYGWIGDRAPRTGAALAFYTVFSLAPILIISIAIAGAVFGEKAARGEIVEQVRGLIGKEGAQAVQSMIEDAHRPGSGLISAIVGMAALLIGATTFFVELKYGLDQIWGVPPEKTSGYWYFLRTRLLSFGLILAIGFLLVVSLVISAIVSALGDYWGFTAAGALLQGLNFILSFALIMALFASTYKVLPGVHIAWKDVWVGATITALLFTIGKTLIGLYLGNSAIASSYGAAGSLILVLVWVYYSAQIFLLGAEFTKFYAYRYGSRRHKTETRQILEAAGRNPTERRT
ncbi:MAG TPA: YihY/virulence factor BrkB family protein [Acidobacteriota bacterium]|jgi:membrane protein